GIRDFHVTGVQTCALPILRGNRVMRVLPLENEPVNECWLSDRDRFSYEALAGEARLDAPMIRQDGEWRVADWPTALDYASHAMRSEGRRVGKGGRYRGEE